MIITPAQVVDYIADKLIHYSLEPSILLRLYVPSPAAGPSANIGPVLAELAPCLAHVRAAVAVTWQVALLDGILAALAAAVAAVFDLPGRSFSAEDTPVLAADLAHLSDFFTEGDVLEPSVVAAALAPLGAVATAACARSHGNAGARLPWRRSQQPRDARDAPPAPPPAPPPPPTPTAPPAPQAQPAAAPPPPLPPAPPPATPWD